ncbi:MAG: trypsin-like peptidase domain-containing protein [Roseiflexaceae bacterium]|nr:trypsin-like peptidase domain-containing protein [Roseiflexaceae bacterium]
MSESPASKTQRWRQRWQRLRAAARNAVPFIAGVLAAFIALLAYSALMPAAPPLTTNDVNTTVATALAAATTPPAFSAQVYQAIQPSFVLIETQKTSANGKSEEALGSGVVVNDRGDILTSLHVVANATDIQVTFADGTKSNADIIASQPEHDIAVLSARQLPAQLVPATLGNPRAMRIGDEAFVVGNPLGLYGSMSVGVISGLNRSFQPSNGTQQLEGLIQIDAAVNPGNSGGPLLNRNGEVIGIVTGLANPIGQDAFIGIGFAVPINVAGSAAGLPPY